MIEIIKIKELSEQQFDQINQLWNEEYPVKLKDRFPILLDGVENYNHYIMEDAHQNVIAWAVDLKKKIKYGSLLLFHFATTKKVLEDY